MNRTEKTTSEDHCGDTNSPLRLSTRPMNSPASPTAIGPLRVPPRKATTNANMTGPDAHAGLNGEAGAVENAGRAAKERAERKHRQVDGVRIEPEDACELRIAARGADRTAEIAEAEQSAQCENEQPRYDNENCLNAGEA